ncbi:MAG: hypothetical protein QOK29_1336 [Rhodospirillaceae bacterium]|jgi:hypothetical protein|nr:hypothetical protein [Rhodospirillaceae bacterium]
MFRSLPRLGTVLLLGLFLAACVPESQNPAGDPAKAVKDPALFGLWETDWEDGQLFLHVFDSGQGTVDVYTVNHKKDGTGEADHYQGFVSAVGQRRIANLQIVDSGSEDSGGAATYVFIAYQMTPDGKLDVHFVNDKPFIAAVTAGKLHGQVTGQGDAQTVLLTDDTATIAAFIAGLDDASLYGKDILFRRVYPS